MVLLGQSLLSSIIEILVRRFSKNVQTVLSLCDIVHLHAENHPLLPARASEQGNVIGSVRIYIYIYMCVQKKIVIE